MNAHGMLRWVFRARIQPSTLRETLKKNRVDRLERQYGKKAALVSEKARTKAGMDRALTMTDMKTVKAMLAWRRGVWGSGRFEKCVCGRDYLFYHWRKCPAVSPPVQAMMVERKLEEVDIQATRLAELFAQWEAQLTTANDEDFDDPGWLTPEEIWDTASEGSVDEEI